MKILRFLTILNICVFSVFAQGIETEQELIFALKRVEAALSPLLKEQNIKMGKVDILWESSLLQAGAKFNEDKNEMEMEIHGGIARAKGLSSDAATLVLCHEFGHILGGAPKHLVGPKNKFKPRFRSANSKAQTGGGYEGQADYFATSKCFREVYKNDDNLKFLEVFESQKKSIPQEIKNKCSSIWKDQNDWALCVRGILAAVNFATINELSRYAALKNNDFKFNLPDPKITYEAISPSTLSSHPSDSNSQCRLETMTQGALCSIPFSIKTNDLDSNIGSCISGSVGGRPACWFNPDNTESVWKNLEAKDNQQWNGVGVLDGKCSASLLETGATENSNAMILTNGHCVDSETSEFVLGRYLNVKSFKKISDADLENFKNSSYQLRIPVKKVVFSTMKSIDAAVIELDVSAQKLKSLGINFYKLGNSAALKESVTHVGIPMRGVLKRNSVLTKATCKVLEDVKIKEHTWNWDVQRTNCTNVDGMSGSPLFSKKAGEENVVVGMLNTTVELDAKGKACDLSMPCEQTANGEELHPELSYSQITSNLLGCFDKNGAFNSLRSTCKIK